VTFKVDTTILSIRYFLGSGVSSGVPLSPSFWFGSGKP